MRSGASLLVLVLLLGCGDGDPAEESPTGERPATGAGAPSVGTAGAAVRPPVAIPDLPADDPVAVALALADAPRAPSGTPGPAVLEAAAEAMELVGRRRPDAALERIAGAPAATGPGALVRALVAARRGEWPAFADAVEDALRAGVAPGPARVVAGRVLAMRGRLAEAEAVLRDAGTDRALAPLALVLLAGEGDGAEALAVSAHAVAARPGDPAAVRARLTVLVALGRLDEAEELLATADRSDPTVLEVLGTVRARRGDSAAAVEAFEAALAVDPGSAAAHRNLAGLFLAAGKEEEGLRHLEAALATADRPGETLGLAPGGGEPELLAKGAGVARGYRVLALRHLADSGHDAARVRGFLERAVRADPSDAAGWRLLAAHLERTGDSAMAAEVLREGSRAVGPERAADLRLALVAVELRRGDREGAADAAGRVPATDPAHGWLRRLGEIPDEAPGVPADPPRTRIATGPDRYSSLGEALFGGSGEIADRASFRARLEAEGYSPALGGDLPAPGERRLVETLVATERGVRTRFLLVAGPVPGQPARFVDEPDPGAPTLLPEALAAGAIRWVRDGAADPAARAVVRALGHLEAGEGEPARAALPEDSSHPVAAFVAARLDPVDPSPIERALEAHPGIPELRLLAAEQRLAVGEVAAALARANRAAEAGLPPGAVLFVARIRALARFGPGSAEAGFAALEEIRAEHPDYLPVYEDLVGNYVLNGRFGEALSVLDALAARFPEAASGAGYRVARGRAEAGFLSQASGREDLERLLDAVDPRVRQRAATLASRLAYGDACDLALRFARDGDGEVRTVAVRAIGEQGLSEALPAVRAAVADPDRHVRGAAARALRLLLSRDAAREIVPLLADPELYVREVAVNELRSIAGREFGFDPAAPEAEREEAVRRWKAWAKGS